MTLRLRIIGTINEKISWDTLPKGTFLTFWRLQKVKWSFPFLTLSQQRCAAVQATTEAKNVGNFPVILVKLHCSELPPSTPNNIEFWVKRLEMSPFGGTTLLGGGGGVKDEGMKPKPIKLSLWSRLLCNYYLYRFFHSASNTGILSL